jgi:ubiquinone/menaquinone biosynthesis C-methylase UbiE
MNAPALPSASNVFAGLLAYETSAVLRSAIEIGLFTAIARGFNTPETIAPQCHAAPRGIRILADFLVVNAFLTKHDNQYRLTAESAIYLDRNSPHYKGDLIEFVQAPFLRQQLDRLSDWVRAGGADVPACVLAPEHPMWVAFARVMAPEMAPAAQGVASIITQLCQNIGTPAPQKILDVAASHGMFGIAFATKDPTCRVVAQDYPKILETTRQNVHAQGLDDRYTFLPGDIRQVEPGTDYDLVLLPNLIHYLDRDATVQLLKKLRTALKPGGRLAVVEFAPNDDRVTPTFGTFALMLLATTPAGDAYTVNEIIAMCAEAGYQQPTAWEVVTERLIVVTNPANP